jgi:hypothetical protein
MAKLKSLKKKKLPKMPKKTDSPHVFAKKAAKRKEVLQYNAAIDKELERREKTIDQLRR